MRLNPIKRHHLMYALRRSLDPLAIGVVFFGIMAFFTKAKFEDFLYAMIPLAALSVMFFGFHLWKVLKDR